MVDVGIDRSRASWWAIGAVLLVAVLLVVHSFVGTFVFGIFIYYATRPGYVRIRRYTSHRRIAAALALLVLALPAILLLTYTLAIALTELNNVDQVDLGPIETFIQPYVDVSGLVEDPASILSDPANVGAVGDVLRSGLGYVGFIGTGLLHLFVMFALAYYLLKDGSKLSRWVVQFGDDRGVLDAYLKAIDRDLKSIFFGNILNAIITGVIGAISFSVLNLFAPPGLRIPYPALTGLLAGAASLIPVVGMKLVYVPVVAYLGLQAFFQEAGFGFVVAVFVVSLVIVDSLPDFVLRPYVSGRNLHIGAVMFAYILGPLLFGWYGIFLGPMLLVFVVHFARIVMPELLSGEPIRPVAVDPSHLLLPAEPPSGADPDPAPGASDGGHPAGANDRPPGEELPDDPASDTTDGRTDDRRDDPGGDATGS